MVHMQLSLAGDNNESGQAKQTPVPFFKDPLTACCNTSWQKNRELTWWVSQSISLSPRFAGRGSTGSLG